MLKEFTFKIYHPDAIYIMYDGTSAYDVYGCDVKDEIEINGAEVLKGPIADTPENADKIEAYIEQYNNEITNNGMNENKKKATRINESQLKAIVVESVKKVLKESYGDILIQYYSPTKGRNSMIVKNLNTAMKMIPSDATYFDITKGDNSSNEENLISWGGKDGYWDNLTNPDFPWGEQGYKNKESIMRKRKF